MSADFFEQCLSWHRAQGKFANGRMREPNLIPNELTPRLYRARLRRLARERGWRLAEYDFNRLRRMGAAEWDALRDKFKE